jgi:hypothetical protein
MKDSSEQIEKKDCPGGMHAHTGYTACHPLDKPHRPGSSADLYHQQTGIENTWYRNHGTTREDYEKEHPKDSTPKAPESTGEPSEPESESKPKPEPESDYRDEKVPGVHQWDSMREIKATNPKLYKNVSSAREVLRKYEGKEGVKSSQIYKQFARALLKDVKDGYGKPVEPHINPQLFNRVEPRYAIQFLNDILKSAEECPIGCRAVKDIRLYSNKGSSTLMAYRYYGIGFEVNTAHNLKDRKIGSKATLTNLKGEETEWDFHFKGQDTTNSIDHEYGHSVSREISALRMMSDEVIPRKFIASELREYASKKYDEDDNRPSKERWGMYIGEYILPLSGHKYGEPEYYKYGEIRISRCDESIVSDIQKIAERYGCEVKIDKKEKHYKSLDSERPDLYKFTLRFEKSKKGIPDAIKEKFKEDPLSTLDKMEYELDYADKIATERVKDCEELYKKIYNVDRIDPTDVYSGYGFSATSGFDKKISADSMKGRSCEERFAEAYADFVIRGENANSMSKLLVAHSQYTYHRCMLDYEGSFEDFVKDKIGMDKFERLITKSIDRIEDVNLRFVDSIKKGIENRQNDTIRKHQAFIESVRKQFDMRTTKYRVPKRLIAFGQEYTLDNGYLQPEDDSDTASGTQYRFVTKHDFWKEYDEGEGQNPDSTTIILYDNGRTWASYMDSKPDKSDMRSGVICTEWGFICYNCTPTRDDDGHGDYIYDVELN